MLAIAGVLALAAVCVALGAMHGAAESASVVGAMAIVQATYTERQPIGLPGQIANMSDASVDTRNVETSGGIGFGLVVGRGSGDFGAVLGAAASTDFLGISVRDVTVLNSASPDKYNQYDNMGVMTEGDMWVTAGGDVNDGDNVTFSSTTGVLSSANTSGTQFAIAGARWMTTAASGKLALVRLTGEMPSA